ncbi:MAG: hypothetical protein QOJ63_184 [Solirubrobacteraceae bacterium]|jgi:hypothetical protein|nr:hypothetical protein [Solirubrobacteraceae bacterium]
MSARLRRTCAGAVVAMLVASPLAGARALLPHDALAALELSHGPALPDALVRPLWTGTVTPSGAGGGEHARAALRIIRREQRYGVLRSILGSHSARIVQFGELQQAGRRVGATALLALPVARRNVHATVPGAVAASTGRRVQFMAPVLRDLLVDVDLRRGEIVGVEPGPASRTSAWAATPSPPVAAPAAAPTAPAFVRPSPHGPRFAPYDGTRSLGRPGRDWPVSLVFTGAATVGKVKQALRATGSRISESVAGSPTAGPAARCASTAIEA